MRTAVLEALDTGEYNSVMVAYAFLAMKKSGMDKTDIYKVLRSFPETFDYYTASEALDAYRKA